MITTRTTECVEWMEDEGSDSEVALTSGGFFCDGRPITVMMAIVCFLFCGAGLPRFENETTTKRVFFVLLKMAQKKKKKNEMSYHAAK
jgi:hypothetical protein